MADFFSTIGNAIGGLFGIPQQQAANKASNQAQTQQGLQNQYGSQAAGVYGGLATQGNAQVGAQNQNYLTLLSRYGSEAGLGNPLVSTNGAAQGAQGRTPPGVTTPGTNPAQGGQTAADQNPYSLDGNQQQQLNQSLAGIAQSQKSAISDFQASMTSSGLSNDPRAMQTGIEQLNEHFAALSAQTQTQFYQQVKQDKLSALQNLITGIQSYGAQGVQEQEAAGSGYLGLATGAQNAANANNSNALTQQQLSQDSISGLLNLAGFGLGGGFSKPTSTSAPTANSSNSGLNISGALSSLF